MEFFRSTHPSTINGMSKEYRESYEYYARFIDVMPLPNYCIESIELNYDALEFLPKSHAGLIDEDTLMSLAQTPSFGYPDSQKTISVPFDYGRALPLAYVDVPFANNHGTVITGKGVGPSGSYYSRANGVDFSYTKNPDVLGLFGEKDAKFDIRASNALLAAGLRTSLSLGYFVLNPERYKDHLKYVWNDRDSKDFIEDAFHQIGNNRDLPVYHFRLGSHPQRLKLFNKVDIEFIDGKKQKIHAARLQAALSLGAATFLRSSSGSSTLRMLMEWISHKYPLDTHSLDEFKTSLNDYSFELFNRLKSVDRNIVECIREDTLTPKDTDCSLSFWDFEKGYYGNRDQHLNAMLCNIQSTMNTYVGLVGIAFGPPKEYSDQSHIFSDPYQQYTIPDF